MLRWIRRKLRKLLPGKSRKDNLSKIYSNLSKTEAMKGKIRHARNNSRTVPPDADLYVSVNFDRSGSMAGNKIDQAKESTLNMLSSLEDSNVALGLVSFGKAVTLENSVTKNFRKIKESVEGLIARGGTPFYEAMALSKREHLNQTTGEKVLVVDTDGKPTSSCEEAILELGGQIKEEGTRIITIGIGGKVNSSFLRRLASTPEDYHFAKAPKDIRPTLETVTDSIVKKTS